MKESLSKTTDSSSGASVTGQSGADNSSYAPVSPGESLVTEDVSCLEIAAEEVSKTAESI